MSHLLMHVWTCAKQAARSCGTCACKDDADGFIKDKAKSSCAEMKEKGGCEGLVADMDLLCSSPLTNMRVL